MSVPTLREQLMVSYLEGHDPDVDDLQQIVSLNDDEIDALFRIYDAVVVHDGCVDSDDAVRLALYLFNGGPNSRPLRAVDPLTTVSDAPIPMTDRCVICQCDMEGNGHQSQLTKGGKTLQHSYCMDCWDDVSQIVRATEDEIRADDGYPREDDHSCWEAQDEEEEENGIWVDTTDGPVFVEPKEKSQEALEESLQPDAIEAVGDRKAVMSDILEAVGDRRRFNGRPKGIIEEEPREICRSSCCGTLGARMRGDSCRGCRGLSKKDLHALRKTNGWTE